MNDEKIVALVEPSFYGIGFVIAAFDQGYKIVSIVSSEDNPRKYQYEGIYHDLIVTDDIRDVDAIYHAIMMSPYVGRFDALIPATDYVTHITAKVAKRLGLKGILYEAAMNARNKDLAHKAYDKKRVPSARYKKVKTYEEAKLAALEIGYPIVMKPTNAASSQNVFFINNTNELKKALKKMISFKNTYMGFKVSNEYLIEEYLDGPEFSVEIFLKDGDPIFSAVTEKTTSPLPHFVELVHTMPTSVHSEKQEEMIHTAVLALKAIGVVNRPSHVELKLTNTGPKIIEVNGRPGGDNIASDLLVHTFGFDIFKATVNYYLNRPIHHITIQNKATSIAYLTADRRGIISDIQGCEHLQNQENVIRFNISVKKGDEVVPAESSDDRLGYIITMGSTPREAKETAIKLIQNIKLQYMESSELS